MLASLLVTIVLAGCEPHDTRLDRAGQNYQTSANWLETSQLPQLIRNSSFDELLFANEWRIQDDYLEIKVCDSEESFLPFGCAAWRDYELRFRILRKNLANGLEIILENATIERFRLVLGADYNSMHKLERETTVGEKQVIQKIKGWTEIGRWMTARLRCQATHLQVWIRDRLLFDFSGSLSPMTGKIRIGARNEGIRLRNFKVTASDGQLLFRGLPTPVKHWSAVGQATVELVPDPYVEGQTNLRITSLTRNTGIEQHHLLVRRGQPLRGFLVGGGQTSEGLLLRLVDQCHTLAEVAVSVPNDQRHEIPFVLLPDTSVDDASLQILTLGKATVWLNKINLTRC